MNTIHKSTSRRRHFPIICFTVGFAICNFLTPVMMAVTGGPTPVTVCIVGPFLGIIVAQLCLLSVWAVFGPLGVAVRLPLTLLLAGLLWMPVLVGFIVSVDPEGVLPVAMKVLWFLPMVLLAAQFPLWIMRLATGGSIFHADMNPRQPTTIGRQFSLRHMMGATFAVAAGFSLAGSGVRFVDSDPSEVWILLAIGCLCCILWSTLATLPCLWAGMMAKRKRVAALAIGAYIVLATLIAWGVIWLMDGAGSVAQAALMFFSCHATLAAVILGTLHMIRFSGYVFVGNRCSQPSLESDCPFAVQDDSGGGPEPAQIAVSAADDSPIADRPI